MKDRLIDLLRKKACKRAVSALTALVMIFNIVPVADIGDELKDIGLFAMPASAADAVPPSNYEFLHNPIDSNKISLTVEDFYRYSRSYEDYAAYHQNDEITLKTSSGNTGYFERGFKGLGTQFNPFSGSIEIEANKPIVLNLDGPLFNYVTDTAVINNGEKLQISRFYGHKIPSGESITDTTPLLARNVVTGSGTKATWNIAVTKPSATDDETLGGQLKSFGGMIGTIGKNAQVTLNVTMDQQTDDTDPVSLKSDSDLGLACGLIKEGASLTFSFGASEGGTLRKIDDIETSSGDVGSLVGEMEAGSTFAYTGGNNQAANKLVKTSGGYAGGLVGKVNKATVVLPDSVYTIEQHITGKQGAGSMYGYYFPKADESGFDVTNYNTDSSQQNGTGDIGGLFGELECDHDYTINTVKTVKSNHASEKSTSFGGLIGRYKTDSLTNVLTIGGITTETHNAGQSSYYGGAIGVADKSSANYILFDGFKVNKAYNANALTFGGLIGSACNSFVDAKDATIAVDGSFNGGGLVGDLGGGVLRMTGTTDLSDAKSASPTSDAHKYGQIVGFRDNALVFAENGWVLKRSAAVEADDIGGWGEVLRFDSRDTETVTETDEETDEETSYEKTYEKFGSGNTVLTVNEAAHTVSIEPYVSSIGTVSDFARTALNIQLESSDILTVPGGSGNLTLTADINLSGTGLTGFTRDNAVSEEHCTFSGNLYTGGKTITLAIGEPYGFRDNADLSDASARTKGDGRIYNHRYNGLFGILNNAVVRESNDSNTNRATLNGSISVSPTANAVYAGSLAGIVRTKANAYVLNVETEIDYGGSKALYLGRLIGEANQLSVNNSSNDYALRIQTSDFTGNITGGNSNDNTCIGGVVGKINHTNNQVQNWRFQSLTLGGKIENTSEKAAQIIGGLVAKIEGYSATDGVYNSRTLTLDKVKTQNYEVSAKTSGSMGGLLGYQWLNTDVVVGAIKSNNTTILTIGSDSKVTATGSPKDMAGLVYNATGKWTVNDLDIDDITVSASGLRSFGMIVNKGWYCASGKDYKKDNSSSAIYLLLPTVGCYTISSAALSSAEVFDELVAYTAYFTTSGNTRSGEDSSGDKYILKNGAGVISIKTDETAGLNMNGTTASKSYQAQTTQGSKPNPWSRYYYNLDTVTVSGASGWGSASAQKKLMSWGLNKYAHQSIRDNFYDGFNGTISSATYDMNGYSWYPVDADESTTVQGTFKFYNYEFEQSEAANGGAKNSQKTSLYDNAKSTATQHYLLHAGLLRNVYSGKSVTVNSVTLQGNTPVIDDFSGALICGKVSGSSDTNKVKIGIDGLTLDGAYIHNIPNVTGEELSYAPLVINKIAQYTTLTAKNISTTNKYQTSAPYIKNDGTYPKAASSLIGEVGSSSAKGINLEFTKIKIDGRKSDIGDSTKNAALDSAYGTYRSVFTKATLLDKFEFDSGSTGTYTYNWANDWGSDNRYVTYGAEVGYVTEGEYPNMERKYMEGSTTDAEEFTNPEISNDTTGDYDGNFRTKFLPYVATGYDANGTTHQLEVNHRTTIAEGCGTYNDPYMINNSTDLETFAKILNGTLTEGLTVTLPNSTERGAYWCDDKSGKSHHKQFAYGESTFDCAGETSLSAEEVRTYLAGAYYKFGKNVELSANFPGLSNFTAIDNTNRFAVFRGVIDGGGYTITNKSTAPLIVNSYGCVVRNLTISVESTNSIVLTQSNNTDEFPTCKSYGGVIANVLGGDNIFENVSVTYSSMNSAIDIKGDYKQIIPIGGYIGVIADGAVIFKKMGTVSQGLSTISSTGIKSTVSVYDEDEEDWINTETIIPVSAPQYLYINPIIGRVLNGYAVTESSSYVTDEDDVTMHNGTKNYSIADIDKTETNNLSTGAYTAVSGATGMYSTDVSIPNAQAWFVMSLLTQSSTTVGAPNTLALGASNSYGGTYHRMRCAAYSNVGTNAANDSKPADYNDAKEDQNSTTVPFLVKNYTDEISGTTKYGVLALTNSKTVCNLNLGGTDTEWTLPDGYRGVGTIGFNRRSDLTDRTISLHKFNGKNQNGSGSVVTIAMNMSLQHYESGFDNYLPVNNSQGGFGLFNTLRHNRSDQGSIESDYKISELNITGKIDYYVYFHDKTNGVTTYNKTSIQNAAYLNCGGISGYAGFGGNDSITVETIGVSGLTVNGFETAGGFFGNLQLSNGNASSHQVSISGIDAQEAFTVHSKRYAGGIIGYFKQGNLSISNVAIKLPTVLNEYKGQDTSDNAVDFDNGAGGVIGYCQNVNGNSPIELSNIVLGQLNSDIESRIGYIEDYTCAKKEANVVAGGIIGRNNTVVGSNSYSLKFDNCNVYNISIFGHRVGGLIGSDAADNNTNTSSKIVIYNSQVKSDNDSVLYGLIPEQIKHRNCGGIMGGSRAGKGVVIDTCTVEGYTFQGFQDTAGVCANVEGGAFEVRNFTIKNVTMKSDYSACLFGWLNQPLSGYNILCDNIQFQDRKGGTTYNATQHGYLVAKNNIKNIKIAGLSIQNATPKSSAYFIPPRLSGTNDYNANGGYVVFADYNGAASDSNKTFSDINNTTNVKDYNNQIVTDNTPYVTSSPKMFIGTDQFLTGDAVSSTTYEDSALEQIILDKQDPEKSKNGAQSYQTAPAVDTSLLKDITDHLTTSRDEFGIQSMPNFPMLKVEDSDKAKVTAYINYYIQNLTNSPSTFIFQLDKTSDNKENIYKVTMHKCTYDKDTGKFTVGADGSGSLKRYTTGFQMEANRIDNADPNTPQFTLMDVQFLNPSKNSEVAYHLYVPIYVKKLIQYKFSAKIISGTNYYAGAYDNINEHNTLFENLGNPVTMKVEYTYDRTASDWAEAINSGENVLTDSNFYKELKLSMNDNGWIPDSRLVLVDPNNNDKHYYLDTGVADKDSSGYYHIPFDKFTTDGTDSATAYKPAPLNSLLDVTCTDTDNGPLVITTDDTKATVKDQSGTMYMPRPTGNTSQGYTATVTAIRPETYYLSFFTNKDKGNDRIYHYEISSLERFEKHDDSDTNWKPNKIIRAYNYPVHLIIGKLYTNDDFTLSVNTPRSPGTYKMTKDNNVIEVTMTAHVALTDEAKIERVWQNLNENSNSTIYQTFLMNYDMKEKDALTSKIGVDTSAIQSITVTKYMIYYGLVVPTTDAELAANPGEEIAYSDPEELMTSNYIELRNNKNLNEYLGNSAAGHDNAATIQVTFAIEYPDVNLAKQFPERSDETNTEIGSLVRGYSNISSVAESGAYSSTSNPAASQHRYYTKNTAASKLTYSVVKTTDSAAGHYSSLGINPFDEQDSKSPTNKGHIDSTALYNFMDFSDPGDYIEFNISLTCKKDGYDNTPLVLGDYLRNLTVKAGSTLLYTQGDTVDTENIKGHISSDGKILTLRAHKSKLTEVSKKAYSIDISYDVLTGEKNGFGSTKAYSNYKVSLTADIYSDMSEESTLNNPTHASDHIIYTNSKLQYKMIA
ncbi:hypothetical protein [Ruminococcus sp. NK3A76]|uniref:hypothetical protein n=1 Tax=Ruminococcus sp. NK3A76 TaxID=877411 RepID=UPI00048FA5E7|nr:hypothetical protein [Ruminococcus sp. NK3A76]